MKDCNKKIYQKIREYLDGCLTPFVENVIEYKDETFGNLHQVVQYNRTGSDTLLGAIGNMFDFDFFDCKEVVSFVPFCNLTATENTAVTVDVSVEDIQSILLSVHDKIKKELNNRFYKVCMDILEQNPHLADRHCCGDYMSPNDKVEIKFNKL